MTVATENWLNPATTLVTCTPAPYLQAARKRKFAIMAINPDLPQAGPSNTLQREHLIRRLALHLWDTYLRVAQARHIVLVATGPGVAAMGTLLNERSAEYERRVLATATFARRTDSELPVAPMNLGRWFYGHSLMMIPNEAPVGEGLDMNQRLGRCISAGASRGGPGTGAPA